MLMSKETLKHLNECRDLINGIVSPFGVEKKAALGGDGNDTQFEQSFSNLAHAFIKDKAPSLLDYEVGFQLMDRNEDNTKAVAIFGFKVGKQWLYTPIFFLNGDIKGTELLYIKDQDQFVPLKENWLNYILQRKPAVMGKNTDRNLQALGVLSPDLQAFSRPPAKFASAGGMEAGEAAFAYFATTNPLNDKKYSDVRDLPQFLKEAGKEVIVSLVKGMMAYPQAAEAVDAVYGLAEIKRAASVAKDKPLNLPADYKPVKPSEGVKMELPKADRSQAGPDSITGEQLGGISNPEGQTDKPRFGFGDLDAGKKVTKPEAAKPQATPKVEENKPSGEFTPLEPGDPGFTPKKEETPFYQDWYNKAEGFLGDNQYLQHIPKMFDSRLATLGIGAGIPLALWAAYNATKDDDEEETKKRIIINNYLNKAGEYAGSCSKNNDRDGDKIS